MKASKPHHDGVVNMLKADPKLAQEYLATALQEASLPGGQFALVAALRHMADVQATTTVDQPRVKSS